MQRVDAAKARIESLNPLVTVETVPDASAVAGDALDGLLRGVDMVCVTDSDRETMVRDSSPPRAHELSGRCMPVADRSASMTRVEERGSRSTPAAHTGSMAIFSATCSRTTISRRTSVCLRVSGDRVRTDPVLPAT